MDFKIQVATDAHLKYAKEICTTIEHSAKLRGTGIAKRDHKYIKRKIQNGNSVIALLKNTFAGFCYIETWEHGKYVCLLYTSPSPRDKRQSRMPSSA